MNTNDPSAQAVPAGNETLLDGLQGAAFEYFRHEANPDNGLVADSTRPGSPASIGATGFALTLYPIGVERGSMPRAEAVARTLAALRHLWHAPQGPEPDATGHRGFFYHFLDMERGRRALECELSTIDTAFLLAGALLAGRYFQGDDADEQEIRRLADALYRRADWQWAQNGGCALATAWTPEQGFAHNRWYGYSEALILYVLGLGSPTHPLPPNSYAAWTTRYDWREAYGYGLLYAGPLFIHQFSHLWIDFRQIQDAYMRTKGIDYFENSRRATYAQRDYALQNPHGFRNYGEHCWGITASDGPDRTCEVAGHERRFFGYLARGAPFGPDDGTLAPWAAASLPFAPEIVLPTLHYLSGLHGGAAVAYGFTGSFNPTVPDPAHPEIGWLSPWHLGINQGPIVIMAENYRSGLVWRLMRGCPYVVKGLRRAGFGGGWLGRD